MRTHTHTSWMLYAWCTNELLKYWKLVCAWEGGSFMFNGKVSVSVHNLYSTLFDDVVFFIVIVVVVVVVVAAMILGCYKRTRHMAMAPVDGRLRSLMCPDCFIDEVSGHWVKFYFRLKSSDHLDQQKQTLIDTHHTHTHNWKCITKCHWKLHTSR